MIGSRGVPPPVIECGDSFIVIISDIDTNPIVLKNITVVNINISRSIDDPYAIIVSGDLAVLDHHVVNIDKDPGAKLAFGTLDTLYSEGLLFKSAIFKPPLYDATREGKIATFYIGAFWSEFLRQNLPDMEGKWRVMPAPMFQDIGKRGAPVIAIESLLKKLKMPYAELYKKYWLDFHLNGEARNAWTDKMVEQNAPYPNPMTMELLADPFWKEPSAYYGGQSFREMEGIGLQNPSENLRVTTNDAEADQIISAEVEKYVAGDQTMAQAIENMGKVLRDRIGKAPAAK